MVSHWYFTSDIMLNHQDVRVLISCFAGGHLGVLLELQEERNERAAEPLLRDGPGAEVSQSY
jgi:hypothetical protein